MNDSTTQSDAHGHSVPRPKHRKIGHDTSANLAHQTNDLFNKDQGRLMRMLEDPQFSDVTVFVGPQKEPFKLHRAVICLSSEFFKAACKPNFMEGIIGEISLPEIDPEIFRMIARWQYEGGMDLIPEYGDLTLKVQKAADFLQMPQLRLDLLQRLVTFTSTKYDGLTRPEKTDVYWFLVEFCALCRPSDLENTIKCVGNVHRYWEDEPNDLHDGMCNNKYNEIFLTSLIISLQRSRRPVAKKMP